MSLEVCFCPAAAGAGGLELEEGAARVHGDVRHALVLLPAAKRGLVAEAPVHTHRDGHGAPGGGPALAPRPRLQEGQGPAADVLRGRLERLEEESLRRCRGLRRVARRRQPLVVVALLEGAEVDRVVLKEGERGGGALRVLVEHSRLELLGAEAKGALFRKRKRLLRVRASR